MQTRAWMLALLLPPLLAAGCNGRAPNLKVPEGLNGAPAEARMFWAAPRDVAERIRAAGLPLNDHEDETYHIHSLLEVYKDGQQVMVPPSVGIDSKNKVYSPLHTHQAAGVLHVESATPITVTLGQFFILWDVELTGARAWVNGQPVADPAAIELADQRVITVVFGTPPAALGLPE